jgi:hypothetical protein
MAGTVTLWVLASYPAYLLGGEDGLLFSGVAAGLCLLPTAATLLWCDLVLGGSPEQQLMAVFGGTALRIVFVIGVAMVLYQSVEQFHSGRFWLWIIVFYLATLTLEVVLVVRRQAALDKASRPDRPSV